jgi:hypothetical protein
LVRFLRSRASRFISSIISPLQFELSLDANPACFDAVRQLLGHTSLRSTINAYLLTYEGIEKLLGRRVTRRPLPPAKASWDDYDERTRLDRSIHASRAGPKLLISLLGEMRSAIDQPLASGPPHKGGHPIKHLYRHAIAMELAMHYHWFFEEYPTTAPTGQFARFCVAVLNELECDTTGFEKTLPDILDDAATNFVPNYSPRSRRRISSRK